MNEVWKEIPSFSNYKISNTGKIIGTRGNTYRQSRHKNMGEK